MTDLWADFTPPEDVKAPVHLLREQASVLANKKKGIVRAFTSSAPAADGKFWLGFDLESPNFRRYSYVCWS
jgi:hypothetical protein